MFHQRVKREHQKNPYMNQYCKLLTLIVLIDHPCYVVEECPGIRESIKMAHSIHGQKTMVDSNTVIVVRDWEKEWPKKFLPFDDDQETGNNKLEETNIEEEEEESGDSD